MEYLALLLPVCLCWRARHLLAATAAAALIIAAAGSRGGTASLVYLIPVLAVTFVLSYRLGDAGGWRRTIAGPALLAAVAEVVNRGFNPFLLMIAFGPWAAGVFVRSRRRLAAELAEAGELLEAERSRYAAEAVRYERVHLARELHDTVAHWLTAVVIQARAGQVRSLTQQESVAATFADIMTAAGRADEELTRAATLLGRTALRLTHSSVSRGPFRCAMLNPGERRTSRGDRHSRLRCRGPWRRHPDRRESTGRGARPWGRRRACRLGLSDRSARVTHLAALDQCRMSPWERVDPSCGSPRLRHAVPT